MEEGDTNSILSHDGVFLLRPKAIDDFTPYKYLNLPPRSTK